MIQSNNWSGDVESEVGKSSHSDGSFTLQYRVLGEGGEGGAE
jgi:hypothetical protein